MNRGDLIKRVRSMTRDLSNSIFREVDIVDYINEGIDRFRSVPQLKTMKYMESNDDVPNLLPEQFHHLLAVYSASRCFGQDERHYQASTYMNEFEVKMEELINKIQNGEIVIVDEYGNPILDGDIDTDYIVDVYFKKAYRNDDFDRP